jgi:hypothetical protein
MPCLSFGIGRLLLNAVEEGAVVTQLTATRAQTTVRQSALTHDLLFNSPALAGLDAQFLYLWLRL